MQRRIRYVLLGMVLIMLVLSTTTSLGGFKVEKKTVENNVKSNMLNGAVLAVTTDKDIYGPGETVTIYLTNIGDEILYGGGPIITIYNNESEIVFQEATYCWHELEPEEYITWTWNQTDQQGSQVPNGVYKIEGSLFGVGETFVNCSLLAVTNEDLVTHLDGIIGENGWYISCVTLTILYDPEIIKEVRVNGEIYVGPVEICENGAEICAVDWEGNEDCWSLILDIDITLPTEDVTLEVYREGFQWYVKFTCIATDSMSGMDRVEMYINDGRVKVISSPGPTYEFVIEFSSVLMDVVICFKHYDRAGNMIEDVIPGSCITPLPDFQQQQSTNPLFLRLLERFPNAFQLLQQIIGQ